MKEWQEIYSNYEEKKMEGVKQALQFINNEIKDVAGEDEELFLLLKAQVLAAMKNSDSNLHMSIITLIVGAAAFVAAVLSVIVSAVPNSTGKMGCFVAVSGVMIIVVVMGCAAYMMEKVKKYMRMQEAFNVFSLCLEKYEQEHFLK